MRRGLDKCKEVSTGSLTVGAAPVPGAAPLGLLVSVGEVIA